MKKCRGQYGKRRTHDYERVDEYILSYVLSFVSSNRPNMVKAAVIEKYSLFFSEAINLAFKRKHGRSGYNPIRHFKRSFM